MGTTLLSSTLSSLKHMRDRTLHYTSRFWVQKLVCCLSRWRRADSFLIRKSLGIKPLVAGTGCEHGDDDDAADAANPETAVTGNTLIRVDLEQRVSPSPKERHWK